MAFVSVRDLDVYYELAGDGTRVLSISGSGNDLRSNPNRGDGPLERSFLTLSYDQRGLGQTSKPDASYTMADYADDAAALMGALGWPDAHVVGLSFGGMVAQHLAIRHPDRVNRLVLGCTSAGGAGGSSFDLRRNLELDPGQRRARSIQLLDSRSDFRVDPPVLAPGLDAIAAMFDGAPGAADPTRQAGFGRQLDARAAHDTWNQLHQISAPTLVVSGRYDSQAPLANGQRLAGAIPGARLYVADGGHAFMLQDPTAWPVIIAFLRAD